MFENTKFTIDAALIKELGLEKSDLPINASIAPGARVFRYPKLADVFIMESDLYGNAMPENACFLAFYGSHGFIGKHLQIETLKHASLQDIREMISAHANG